MMQLTKSAVAIINTDRFPVKILSSYAEINDYLDQAELLVVFTAGTVILEKDHIRDILLNGISDSIGLMGHLLQFSSEITPQLDEQFFIIRTKAFKHLDFTIGDEIETKLIRSNSSEHDDHSPSWFKLADGKEKRITEFGTHLIVDCLLNGYKTSNFTQEWRFPETKNKLINVDRFDYPAHGSFYPKENTELFSKALKTLEVLPGLNISQEMGIVAMNSILEFNILNARHTETIDICRDAEVVVCPATGFLPEICAVKSNANVIIIYDKNPNNIEFKKHLYDNWDGNDYDKFASEYAKARNLILEPFFDSDIEKLSDRSVETEEFLSRWKFWKETVSIKFIHADLIKDIDVILGYVNENTIIHTSSILTMYPLTAFVYDQDEIDAVRKKIAMKNSQWFEIWN
jgi:hypothetical protein